MDLREFLSILRQVPGAYLQRIVGVEVLRYRREWGEVGAVEAVLEHVKGERLPTTEWQRAAAQLELDSEVAREVVEACDGGDRVAPGLRSTLISIALAVALAGDPLPDAREG